MITIILDHAFSMSGFIKLLQIVSIPYIYNILITIFLIHYSLALLSENKKVITFKILQY